MEVVDTPSAELIQELRDRNYALSIWNIDDVISRAQDLGIECTDREAVHICNEMDRKHDANLGITWDTIDYYLENLQRK